MGFIDESQLDPIGESPSFGGSFISEADLDPVNQPDQGWGTSIYKFIAGQDVEPPSSIGEAFSNAASNLTSSDWWLTRPSGEKLSLGQAVAGPASKALQGLTFGTGDEIVAGGNSIIDFLTGNPTTYDQRLAETRGIQKSFEDASPTVAGALELGGAIRMPVANVLSSGTGLKTAATNIAKGTGLGALFGGLSGFADSEGGFENRATGAGYGVGLGGAVGGGLTTGVQGLQGLYRLGKSGYQSIKNFLNPNIAQEGDDLARATIGQFTNADELAARLQKPIADDLLTANKRTAEIANDPGLALLTKTIEKTIPEANTIGLAKDLARENIRAGIFNAAQGGTISKETAGRIVRQGLQENQQVLTKSIGSQYTKATASKGTVPIQTVKMAVNDAVEAEMKFGLGIDPSTAKFVEKFKALPANAPLNTVNEFRKKAGGLIGDLRSNLSKTPEQNSSMNVLRTMFGGLDEAEKYATTAAAQGVTKQGIKKGISGGAAKALEKGRELTKTRGETFGKGAAGAILKQDQFKQFKLPDSKVLGKAISTPEDARQIIKGLKAKTENKAAMQAGLMEELSLRGSDSKGVFTAARFANNWKKIRPVANEVLSKTQINAIDKVKNDLLSKANFEAIASNASKGQSVTAQSEGAAGIMKDLITQKAKNKSGILGRFFESIGEKKALEVKEVADEILVKMAFDPKYAKDFLSKPSPAAIDNLSKGFISYLNKPLGLIGQEIGSSISQKSEETHKSQNSILPGTQVKQPSFNSKLDSIVNQQIDKAMEVPKIITAKRVNTPSKAEEFVEKEEGGQKLKAYNPPAKGSGITVGLGVDLGQWSKEDLENAGVSSKTTNKLRKYLGLKDATARAFLKENPLTLTKSEADELDSAIKSDIFGKVESKLKDNGITLAKLPDEAQAVVKSLAYNFGSSVDEKIPSIWSAILRKDWSKVQSLLINTKWKQPELVARRQREAELLSRIA